MRDITDNGSRPYSLVMCGLGLLLVVLGVLILFVPAEEFLPAENAVTGNAFIRRALDTFYLWPLAIIVFVLGAVVSMFHLAALGQAPPLLRIDDRGLQYFRFGRRPVPWIAIEAVAFDDRLLGLPGTDRVRLILDDRTAILGRQPRLHHYLRRLTRPFDRENFVIHSAELSISADALAGQLRRRLRHI